ncbi:ABC transporter ATP-binding protein [Metabacillus halosaccharovorans]|uniref:ABC transporter ATP-binding protein n=1 Tax=Metabacillus halosaccharovorans TaxID=930124 RepID=UPI00203CABDF|nr:ABC transporter ATP-binding protein [Metabacillus halosaccharovorans]MCM3444406.1 ABC transporter ATP-binding protein/permease [Metabacillus halosaccharovorans]
MSEKKQRGGHPMRGGRPNGHGMMAVEKPKDFKKTFKRLLGYLKPWKNRLIVVTIAAIFSTLFNVISPKLLGDATSSIFDSFSTGTSVDFEYIARILLLLICLYLFSSLFSYLQQYVMASISQRTVAQLRKEVNEKLSRLPLKYFDQHSHGDLLSRAVNDIDNINNSLQQALTQVINSVISILGIIIMMLVISPVLTLVVLVTIPLSLFVAGFITKFSQKHFVKQQEELGNINGHIEEMFTGHQVIKAFGREEKSIETFDKINDQLYDSSWRAQFISGLMMPLMGFVGNLGFIIVAISGGLLVLNGSIRVGDVQAFIQYTQQISHPLAQVAGIANMIQVAIASAERVFILLDEEEEKEEKDASIQVSSLRGHIEFDHIQFGYDKSHPIIHDVSLEVNEGQTVAIVGPTGAGKTTIVNLLMRFYELDKGSIKVDGVGLSDMSREQVRSMFAMVLQDTWLFNGTIRENIAYGNKDATDQEIEEAAKNAYADDFIRTLPDGYDTMLGEDATNFSQGQRQLLTIARAIIANPKILILDEATSSVDTRTEMNIQKAMNNLLNGRTSFVIAHRLSTIRDADLILVMNQGNIIEKGTHEELLAAGGFYSDLYESQFSQAESVSS